MLITNEKQLQSMIMKELSKAFQIASFNIQKELWENVFLRTSILPESEFYSRTGQFLKSVINPKIKISASGVSVTIGINPKTMKSKKTPVGKFNAHMSLNGDTEYKGESISELLLQWWDEGTTQTKWDLPELPQTDFWYDVMGARLSDADPQYKLAQDKFEEILVRELSKIGTITKL